MKIALAVLYFFASILGPIAMLWGGFVLAPPEYVVDKTVLAVEGGAFKRPDRVLPAFKSRQPFQYHGALAGLEGKEGRIRVVVLAFTGAGEARAAFKEYAGRVTAGSGSDQSERPDVKHYRNRQAGLWGRMRVIDEFVFHAEAPSEESLESAFGKAGFLIPNPRANLLTDVFRTDRYLLHILAAVLFWAALQLRVWNQLGSWATTVAPFGGVQPVSEAELRRRLFAINELDVPFRVHERKDRTIDVTWRLADAKWAGLMTLNKVQVIQIIRMRLDPRKQACKAVDIARAVRASGGGLTLGFSLAFSFFRGIVLKQWEYERQYGLIFKDGRLTFDQAYEYRFNHDELKNPLVNIVVRSGWKYKPVMFFSRILGG